MGGETVGGERNIKPSTCYVRCEGPISCLYLPLSSLNLVFGRKIDEKPSFVVTVNYDKLSSARRRTDSKKSQIKKTYTNLTIEI